MNSVITASSYVLVHTPDMVLHNGTTITTEKIVNPESEYLKELPKHIRSYEDVIAYAPNQTYIGNMTPEELAAMPQHGTIPKLKLNAKVNLVKSYRRMSFIC